MDSLSDVISKYTGDPESEQYETRRGVTTKISKEAMIKLEAISAHFETKKTPLAGELLEGAINEVFSQVSGSFNEDVATSYEHEIMRLEQSL